MYHSNSSPVNKDGGDGDDHKQQTKHNDNDAIARERLCNHTIEHYYVLAGYMV